jgi:hypothetical protein
MAAGLDSGPLGKEAGRRGGGRGWRAILLALAAGWGAFLAYSAIFLTEDPPLRRAAAADREAATGLDFPAAGSAPLQAARRVAYGLDEPRAGSTPPADPPTAAHASTARVTSAESPAQPGRTGALPEAAATAPPTDRMAAERLDHIGVWGPNAAACGARHRRRGYYQATITPERAKAGRTVCTFHDGHRVGNAWVTAAECSDRGRRWSSQVRLLVEGDRLTWSSAKGTASYVRCGRRAG